MAKTMAVNCDLSGPLEGLDQIERGVLELVRPSAQAGAQVLYDEVLLRVPVSDGPRTLKSGRVIEPGGLKRSIYQAFSADNSSATVATYHVSWNARKAPHGHLIEYGHWTKTQGKHGPLQPKWVPPHAFLRPSYDAKAEASRQAMLRRFLEGATPVFQAVSS